MRSLSHDRPTTRARDSRPSTLTALWAGDGVERAGLFVLLCLLWGFVLFFALQAL